MMSQERFDRTGSPCCPVQRRNTASEQKTILVVEMTPIIEELLVRIFTLAHYRTCTADWRQIATHGWIEHAMNIHPNGIVLDVDIYTKATLTNPLDFLRSFSERWKVTFTGASRPPLFLLTTQAQKRNELQQEAYVDAVVTKPFKPQYLLDTVKTVLERGQERAIKQKVTYRAF